MTLTGPFFFPATSLNLLLMEVVGTRPLSCSNPCTGFPILSEKSSGPCVVQQALWTVLVSSAPITGSFLCDGQSPPFRPSCWLIPICKVLSPKLTELTPSHSCGDLNSELVTRPGHSLTLKSASLCLTVAADTRLIQMSSFPSKP